MKLSIAVVTGEVEEELPVALLSGSFEQRIGKAASLGYDGVELMSARPAQIDAANLRRMLSDRGLEVAAIGSGGVYMTDRLTLLAEDAEVSRRAEARLQELIRLASAVEAPVVTVGGFRGRAAWGGSDGRRQLAEGLSRAADQAAALGVRLAVEPLNRYESDFIRNAAEGLEFIEQTGHKNIGLLLDTFHMNIEEPKLSSSIRMVAAAGRLWHIHIGDSNRLPPGKGHIDFPAIVATLRDAGYTGYLSAELLPQPDPDRAAEQTIAYMRGLVTS